MRRLFAVLALVSTVGPVRADSWSFVAPDPLARKYAAAAAGNGPKIYVAGGLTGTAYATTVEAYDPVGNTWTPLPDLAFPRAGLVLACPQGASLYAIGGSQGIFNNAMTVNEAWDPTTATWTLRMAMPSKRAYAACASVGGTVYVIGGATYIAPPVGSTAPPTTVVGTCEAYQPDIDRWIPKAPMPTPRFLASAAVVNGKIYVVGGVTVQVGGPSGNTLEVEYVPTCEVYDPATNTWTQLANMPTARAGLAVSAVPGGLLEAAGGFDGFHSLNLTERYNPALDVWTERGPLSAPVTGTQGQGLCGATANGSMYVFGGEDVAAPASFDANGNWATTGTLYADAQRYAPDPAVLRASLAADPAVVAVGSLFTVRVTVTAYGDNVALSVTPTLGILSGGAAVTPNATPVPGVAPAGFLDLAPGQSRTYAWTLAATAPGFPMFTFTAVGTDAVSVLPTSAGAWNDAAVTCANRVRLTATLYLAPSPPYGPGSAVLATLAVGEIGGGSAYVSGPALTTSVTGSGTTFTLGPALTLAPSPALFAVPGAPAFTVTTTALWALPLIPPAGAATFTWTLAGRAAGYDVLTGTLLVQDPLFGATTVAASRSTQPSPPAPLAGKQLDGGARLSWNANPAYEQVTGYLVYRSQTPGFAPGPATLIARLSGTVFAGGAPVGFVDQGLVNGQTYDYRVIAINADGAGVPSVELAIRPVSLPAGPGGVRVTSTGPSPLSANPMAGERIQVLLNVPAGVGRLRITAFTLAGERVRDVFDEAVAPGPAVIDWDGRNGKGECVATGGYLLVIDLPDGTRVIRKAAILK